MTVAIRQNTPEWEVARRFTIGSSDIAVIAGESPHKSSYTLAAERLGLIPELVDAETQELFDIGHLMQPVLLQLYERETGRHPKAAPAWRHHPQYEWATASLDGTAPVKRVVEAKWTHSKRWRTGDKVPADVLLQVQWQLFVVGWDVADVVVLDFTKPRVETVERDDAMIDDLLYFAREFMAYLERGELPPIDGSESTRQTLAAKHPRDNGTWLPQQPELAVLTNELAEARATKRIAEDQERTLGNALRAVIGDATGIDGLVSLKKNRDSERVNWPAVAAAYRKALEEVMPLLDVDWMTGHTPKGVISRATLPFLPTVPEFYGPGPAGIEQLHTDRSEGARVLRLLSKGTNE